jgi:dolichol kinase
MTIFLQLLLIPISIGGLLAAMAVVHRLARHYGWSAELQRKCVHVSTGLYALTLPLTFSAAWPVLLLCSVSVLVLGAMRLPALAKTGIGSTIHGVERQSYGEILLAVAVGFTFFRSVGEPVLFVLPVLVLTFSDAAAALTGVRYGQRLFRVENGTKSLEGVTMFFLLTFIIAIVTLLLMTDASRVSVILLSVAVAAFGAEIEADSWRGFDNFFVPVGLHLFLQNNLAATPLAVAGSALLYVAILSGLLAAAPALGLSRHAARGYGVIAFLILSVTAPHNAILPLVAFIGFLVLRRRSPCRSRYPDLDFLAAMAGVSVFWLFIGEWSGHTAINMFNLTFAGVAVLFATLAVGGNALLSVLVGTGIGATVYLVSSENVAASPLWFVPALIASLAICAATAAFRPAVFARWRAPRAFAVALVVPVVLFAVEAITS